MWNHGCVSNHCLRSGSIGAAVRSSLHSVLQVHPMRVIFQISREAPPRLADHAKWSPALHDLIARCLQKARHACMNMMVMGLRPILALDHEPFAWSRGLLPAGIDCQRCVLEPGG